MIKIIAKTVFVSGYVGIFSACPNLFINETRTGLPPLLTDPCLLEVELALDGGLVTLEGGGWMFFS